MAQTPQRFNIVKQRGDFLLTFQYVDWRLWDIDAVAMMIAAGGTALSLGALRNVDVIVEVHFVDGPPEIQLEDFNHAVEGTFTSPTGKFAVMDCTDVFPDASRLEVPPGSCRFIYLVSGVHTIQTEEVAMSINVNS